MSFLNRIFGRTASKPASAKPAGGRAAPTSVSPHQPSTRGGANSAQSVRKELIRVVTRDTLMHNGIPAHWIRADGLTTAVPNREPGVHIRLCVLHWDSRLMLHSVALQQNLEKRIHALDPMAEQWLMGISWQFVLKDDADCPPLPHPGSWTAPPPEAEDTDAAPMTTPGGSADVISGPTRIQTPQGAHDPRAELERMLSERDADFHKRGEDGSGFEKTQPIKL